MVRTYIRRFARDAAEAEDLFQDVSLTVWRHPTGPRDLSKFGSWCRGLVRNAALEQRRKRRAERHEVSLDLEKEDDAMERELMLGFDDDVEGLIACRQLLGRCLHRTSMATQRLLVRRYVLEETAADIALDLGNSAVAVRMKLKRLRTRAAAGGDVAVVNGAPARRRRSGTGPRCPGSGTAKDGNA
jgi:RNA polymerase sigma factor (sigma-70 family)